MKDKNGNEKMKSFGMHDINKSTRRFFSLLVLIILTACLLFSCSSSYKFVKGKAYMCGPFVINKGDVKDEVLIYADGTFKKLMMPKSVNLTEPDGTEYTVQYFEYKNEDNSFVYISEEFPTAGNISETIYTDFSSVSGKTFLYSITSDKKNVFFAMIKDGKPRTFSANLESGETTEVSDLPLLPVRFDQTGENLYLIKYDENMPAAIVEYNLSLKSMRDILIITDRENFNVIYFKLLGGGMFSYSKSETDLGVYTLSDGRLVYSSTLSPKAAAGKYICENFKSLISVDDMFEFTEVKSTGDLEKHTFQIGFKLDETFKAKMLTNANMFAVNSDSTKAAFLYGSKIYILDFNNNSFESIETTEYENTWDSADAVVFLPDGNLVLNRGSIDGEGRMITIPVLVELN